MKCLCLIFAIIIPTVFGFEITAKWIPTSGASPVPSTIQGLPMVSSVDIPRQSTSRLYKPRTTKIGKITTHEASAMAVPTGGPHPSSSNSTHVRFPTWTSTNGVSLIATSTNRPRPSTGRIYGPPSSSSGRIKTHNVNALTVLTDRPNHSDSSTTHAGSPTWTSTPVSVLTISTDRPRHYSSSVPFKRPTWTTRYVASPMTASADSALKSRQTDAADHDDHIYICETSAGSPTSDDVNKAAQRLANTSSIQCIQGKACNCCTDMANFGTASIGVCDGNKLWIYCGNVGGIVKNFVDKCEKNIGGEMLVGGSIYYGGKPNIVVRIYHS